MSWLDVLALSESSTRAMMDRLCAAGLRDYGQAIRPGPVDVATLTLVKRTLATEGEDLLVLLPRGAHDFAIFCGLVVQLVRAGARLDDKPTRLGFRGPVVVIGLDTQVLRRLEAVTVDSEALQLTLLPLRLRSDARVALPWGGIGSLSPGHADRLLYLNTRVGWPRLPDGVTAGAVIIDRTSFRSDVIFQRALDWARTNQAETTIVLADVGDHETKEALETVSQRVVTWPWTPQLVDHAGKERVDDPGSSQLLTNRLLAVPRHEVRAALCSAPAVDLLFRRCFAYMSKANRIDAPYPRSLVATKRLLRGLVPFLGTVDEYNQWAALDHRTTSIASLAFAVREARSREFTGPWLAFGETRWAELRSDLLQLHDLIAGENPKLFALALLLDELTGEEHVADIVVRVANQAAGNALASDLVDYGFDVSEEGGPLTWATLGARLSWAGRPRFEIYPGAPPPWRRSAVSTGEGTHGVFLAYEFEARLLDDSVDHLSKSHRSMLEAAFTRHDLGALPDYEWPSAVHSTRTFMIAKPESEPSRAQPGTLELDFSALFEPDTDDHEARLRVGGDDEPARALAVELEPGGEWWWVGEDHSVEVVRRGVYQALEPAQLHPGDLLIVPRGEGREALFVRAIEAVHTRGDLRAFEVALSRIRIAVHRVYVEHGQKWSAVRRQMQLLGSRISTQAIRLWHTGDTIAPRDAEDIARIGQLGGDELLVEQKNRIAAIAEQIRTLHRQVGRLLTAAMKEAREGTGPHLTALAEVLGSADVDELLDEFQLRAVRGVDEAVEVPSYLVGSVQRRRPGGS